MRERAGLFHRPPSGDRALLNCNDWYGAGVVVGLTGTTIPSSTYCRWYGIGRGGAWDQFKIGVRHGRALRETSHQRTASGTAQCPQSGGLALPEQPGGIAERLTGARLGRYEDARA